MVRFDNYVTSLDNTWKRMSAPDKMTTYKRAIKLGSFKTLEPSWRKQLIKFKQLAMVARLRRR